MDNIKFNQTILKNKDDSMDDLSTFTHEMVKKSIMSIIRVYAVTYLLSNLR